MAVRVVRLVLLLLLLVPLTAAPQSKKFQRRQRTRVAKDGGSILSDRSRGRGTHRRRSAAGGGGGDSSGTWLPWIGADDAALDARQHAAIASARRQVQEDVAVGVRQYTALAQGALARGQHEAAERVLTEGEAVVRAAGPEAEFLRGMLLLVRAGLQRCQGRFAEALASFDLMNRLLPVGSSGVAARGGDAGTGHRLTQPAPATAAAAEEKLAAVRRLYALDLIKLQLASAAAATGGATAGQLPGLQARRRAEETALLRAGPWTSAGQLPRDFSPGLRAAPWWSVSELLGAAQARALLEVLRAARPRLEGEHRRLRRAGMVATERECIHDERRGEWAQFEFLGATAAARRRGDACDAAASPVGCEVVAAVGQILRAGAMGSGGGRPWGLRQRRKLKGGGGGGRARERVLAEEGADRRISPIVLRAGYSTLPSGRAHIRPHFGETNAQLKLHFGVSVPADADGSPCAWLRVGEGEEAAVRAWAQGDVLFFDDSFEHEVNADCTQARVILQLVVRHPQSEQ
jgi:hypothetical protein